MPTAHFRRPACRWRAVLIPAVLCCAAAGAQAQVVSGLLSTTTATITNLADLLLLGGASHYGQRRDAGVTAANATDCRAQERHRGVQRVSYGTASPRNRQLLNDCTPLGAPTDPAAP